jgi:hypothetical protein
MTVKAGHRSYGNMRWIRIKIRRKDYLSMREEDILATI